MDPILADLEEELQYTFKRKKLLTEALTHSSVKDDKHPSNERLEFLGDSVLGLIITEHLFKTFKDLDEGQLTSVKSIVVSRASLIKIAREISVRKYLSVGRGISKKRAIPVSMLADSVEALIGAVYLDGGMRAARRLIISRFAPLASKALRSRKSTNYKSRLQYYVQKKFGITPHYKLLAQEGPEHNKKFSLVAIVGSEEYPPGLGNTKKEAGQKAARQALKVLQEEYGKLSGPER